MTSDYGIASDRGHYRFSRIEIGKLHFCSDGLIA